MTTLYDRIAPYLRRRSPASAQEVEGKTDFICHALKLAQAHGSITKVEVEKVDSVVQGFLTHADVPTLCRYASQKGWWANLPESMRRDKIQLWRHAMLGLWCAAVEPKLKES